MARFISRRLLLSLLTLWLLATIVFIIANVLPNDVGRTILGPFAPQETVDALNERLGTNRPLFVRYVESIAGIVTLDFGDSFVVRPAGPAHAARRDRPVGQAGRPRPADHDPARDRRRPVRRPAPRQTRRPRDRAARRDLVVDPRVHHRHDPGRRGRRPARAAAGPGDAPAGRGHPDPDPLPAHAGDGDGHRLLRLHRADDPRRDDRRPAIRLHADRRDEGPDDEPDDAPPRAAQRARSRRSR